MLRKDKISKNRTRNDDIFIIYYIVILYLNPAYILFIYILSLYTGWPILVYPSLSLKIVKGRSDVLIILFQKQKVA